MKRWLAKYGMETTTMVMMGGLIAMMILAGIVIVKECI